MWICQAEAQLVKQNMEMNRQQKPCAREAPQHDQRYRNKNPNISTNIKHNEMQAIPILYRRPSAASQRGGGGLVAPPPFGSSVKDWDRLFSMALPCRTLSMQRCVCACVHDFDFFETYIFVR